MASKEVFFEQYCSICEYRDNDENTEPCSECLEIWFREDSHKPDRFKEAES